MNREASGTKMFGDFAPKLVQLTDDVLFGDMWERKELSKPNRSLITAAALVRSNRPEQWRFHLGNAVKNGFTALQRGIFANCVPAFKRRCCAQTR